MELLLVGIIIGQFITKIINNRELKKLKKAAQKGDLDAQLKIADIYMKGTDFVKINEEEGIQWLNMAAEQGDLETQMKLADMYSRGYYKNREKALKWCQIIGQNANVDINTLKHIAENCWHIEKYEEALAMYLKAAEQGDLESQLKVGDLYLQGTGVKKNYRQAKKWYQKIGQNTDIDIDTLKHIAHKCRYAKKYDEAFKWYLKAAERGDEGAQMTVAEMYTDGKGVQKNCEEAIKWYQKAGQNAGIYELRTIAYNCLYKLENCEEAFKWFLKAAEQGYFEAQIEVGEMYLNGKGVEKNYEEAHRWYQRAGQNADINTFKSMSGNFEAIRKSKEAFKWFLKAAEQGDFETQMEIGNLYFFGNVVERNDEEALRWYQRASQNADVVTLKRIAERCKYMKKYEEAFKLYSKAAEQGDFMSQREARNLYLKGIDVQKISHS